MLAAVRRIPPGASRLTATSPPLPDPARVAGGRHDHARIRDPGTPCHRVIAAGGALGGYGGNLQLKRELLRAESIEVGPNRVRNFSSIRWQGRRT